MLRFITRPVRLFLEFLAAFAGVLIVLAFLLIWRLSASPISSSFLTPYIESGIVNLVPGTRVSIAHSLLTWDNTDRSITLHADGIKMEAGSDHAPIADIPNLAIRVSVLGLLVGRLVPAALLIQNPHVSLERTKEGTLLFGGMAAEQGGGNRTIRDTLARIVDDLANARFTRRLQITEALFTIHDEDTGNVWTVGMPDTMLRRTLVGTLTGEAKMIITQKKQTALIALHYDHNTGKDRHDLTTRFSDIRPAFLAGSASKAAMFDLPLSGEISLGFDDKLALVTEAIDVHGDAGVLKNADLWDTPRPVAHLAIRADYDKKVGKLDIPSVAVDFGGPKLALSLTGKAPSPGATPPRDLDFDLSAKMTGLPMNDFDKIWPKPVIPNARVWMAANLSKGTYDRAEAAFKGILSLNDLGSMTITEGKGTAVASSATVKYVEGMPPVTGVNAEANFDLNQMTVKLTAGGIGDIKLQPSTLHLTDFESHVQNIDLPLHIVGPMPAVLKLLDAPPLGYIKAIGLTPDSVGGKVDGTLNMKFPLLNALLMKDIDIKANANLTGLSSTKLVPGLDISQGDLALVLDKQSFALQGTAALNKVPLHVFWQEAFSENTGKPLRQADVSGDVTGDQWAQLGVKMLAKTQGPIAIKLQMIQKDKKSTSFTGTLDMKQAALQIDDLNWKKPAGAPGLVSFEAEMPAGKDATLKSLAAEGPELKIKGKGVLASDSFRPLSLTLDPFIAGRSNAVLHFTQASGPQGKFSLSIEGKSFDVSGLQNGNYSARVDPQPREYHVKLDKLFTSEEGFISQVQGSAVRDVEGWSAIDLNGLADGGPKLHITLTPAPDGHREFSLTCDDFGKALKGMGLTDTVKNGKLEINGASTVEHPSRIEGVVEIGSFQVKDLPVLVVLMNATSPFGLFDLLSGTIDFDRLKGKFVWQKDTLGLDDVRMPGNAVGMTLGGKIDMDTGAADLHGTMAPFNVVNRVLGAIPLVGDMLTGGEGGGVVGVNYAITGTLDKPDVSVNPASLLTPGFLRDLFFGGGDGGSSDIAPAPSSAPVTAVEKAPSPAMTNVNK